MPRQQHWNYWGNQQPGGRFADSISAVVLIIRPQTLWLEHCLPLHAIASHRNPSSTFLGKLSLGVATKGSVRGKTVRPDTSAAPMLPRSTACFSQDTPSGIFCRSGRGGQKSGAMTSSLP